MENKKVLVTKENLIKYLNDNQYTVEYVGFNNGRYRLLKTFARNNKLYISECVGNTATVDNFCGKSITEKDNVMWKLAIKQILYIINNLVDENNLTEKEAVFSFIGKLTNEYGEKAYLSK